MGYKTILVHLGDDAEDVHRLRTAFGLGAQFGATVMGVGALAWDPYLDPTMSYADGETVVRLKREVEEEIQLAQAVFEVEAKGYPHPVVWRGAVDYPAPAINELACGADLIVAGRAPKRTDIRHFPPPADLVMGSGLPVYLVPRGGVAAPPTAVLVAWKNTRETRRAVADAMPLLQAAAKVYVVAVGEPEAREANTRADLDAVVERLNRHGVFAEASIVPQIRSDLADDLMDVAESRGCDLTVLGAYGHSRLREWAFGGVTQELLADCAKPLFFSR